MHLVLRYVFILLIRLFYRQIRISGIDALAGDLPTILVANHPNGLLDPLVMRVAAGRPVAFLAKSTLFGNPLGRAAMRAFHAIPVFRPKDGADTSKNEETFRRAHEVLRAGGLLMLFPEGVSHSDPSLKPLKTGAARIALGAEAGTSWQLGLRVLPVGLLYEDKGIFRTRVAGKVGAPIVITDYAQQHATDERGAVEALTTRIQEALSDVVLQADSSELWNGLVAVAAWTSVDGGRDVVAREARARSLAAAYRRLAARDPARAAKVVDAARHFARILRFLGVDDPFALEDARSLRVSSVLRFLGGVGLLAPFALVGALLGWVPYRLTGLLANHFGKDTDLLGTLKALIGLVLMTATWLAEAIAVGVFLGPIAGLLAFPLGPLTGFAALRWSERLQLRREALKTWWLRANHARITGEIRAHRRELCRLVEEALAAAGIDEAA